MSLIANTEDDSVITLTFDSSSECYEWKLDIKRQVANVISWKNAFTEQMRIEETKKNRLSIPSKASFYDQIHIEEITSKISFSKFTFLWPLGPLLCLSSCVKNKQNTYSPTIFRNKQT